MTDELVEWRAGVRTRLHAGASTGARALCVIEQWCEPGLGAPRHTHLDVEETIVVVEGEATFDVDGSVVVVGAGGSILLPARSWHGFVNSGDGVLRTLAAFGAAAAPAVYVHEPGVVLEIGGVGETMRDAHRAVRGADGSRT